jgi:hypothetical protein
MVEIIIKFVKRGNGLRKITNKKGRYWLASVVG